MAADLFGIPGLTVAGVSTTGIFLSIIGYFFWYLVQRKKLTIEDRAALDGGFVNTTRHLMTENRRLRGDLQRVEERFDTYRTKCEEEADLARLRNVERANDIVGLRRQLRAIAVACMTYIPSSTLAEHPFLARMLDEVLAYEDEAASSAKL